MSDYVDAPMPYIIGVNREIWKKIKEEKSGNFPGDLSIFDIDKGAFKCSETLPDFPPGLMQNCYNNLLEIFNETKSQEKAKGFEV